MMPTRAADLVILELLDARDRLGLRGIALRRHMQALTRTPWSHGKLQGALHRIDRDQLPCYCAKPENRDGGLPERWWA